MRAVYHDFNDANDPEAYPPTPRPVGLWLEEDDEGRDAEGKSGETCAAEKQDGPLLSDGAQDEKKAIQVDFLAKFTKEGPKVVLVDGSVKKQRLLRDDLFVGHPDRERLLGQIEGMALGQQVLIHGHSLIDSYKLCGMATPSALLAEVNAAAVETGADAGEVSNMSEDREEDVNNDTDILKVLDEDVKTDVEGEQEGMSDVRRTRRVDTDLRLPTGAEAVDLEGGLSLKSSPLSDCPSDLSEWQVDDQVSMSMCISLTIVQHLHSSRRPLVRRPRDRIRSGRATVQIMTVM